MHHRFIDITGKTFGRYTVLREAGRNIHGGVMWLCRCECGIEKVVCGDGLKTGQTKSCGCLASENTIKRNFKHGKNPRGRTAPEYYTWYNIMARCYNAKNNRYKTYGARGIKVCERWHDFKNFLADMGDRPSDLHSIDRINNDLDYSPENCRWTTQEVQDRNRTSNRWIEYDGRKMIISDWARELKCDYRGISYFLSKQKPFSEIIDYYKNHKRKSRTIKL